MCNLGIFTTLVYSSPGRLRAQGIPRNLSKMYDFKTRGTFRILSNIYDGKFYSQPCVTPAYLEPWHIQNPRHIQNTAKHLSRNILFKTLCNPDIFKTLVYSELWYILKSNHIQNPIEYPRYSNYSKIYLFLFSQLPMIYWKHKFLETMQSQWGLIYYRK